jgi:hypothetical protein
MKTKWQQLRLRTHLRPAQHDPLLRSECREGVLAEAVGAVKGGHLCRPQPDAGHSATAGGGGGGRGAVAEGELYTHEGLRRKGSTAARRNAESKGKREGADGSEAEDE